MPPILVRLPPQLDDLVNERRGTQTRAAFLVAALAQYLEIEGDVRIPTRGRPKKSATAPDAPREVRGLVAIPDVASLRTVRWKDITESFPWHANREASRTLYVADDGSYVRFSYDERDSSTGKAIVDIIRGKGGFWNGAAWPITAPDVLEAVKARALRARPAWDIKLMSDIEVEGWSFAKIETLDVGKDSQMLRLDRAALVASGRKYPAETRDFIWHMVKSTEVPWIHDPLDENTLFSLPMPAAKIASLVGHLEMVEAVEVARFSATPAEQRSWSSQQVSYERDIGLVHAKIALANPIHRFLLSGVAAAIKPGDSVGPDVTVTSDKWLEVADAFVAMGGTIQERAAGTSRFTAGDIDVSTIPGWEWPAENSYRFFEHQRNGIRFLLDRRMRAILGDEMGLGKTGTAVGAAKACGAKRIIVVAPANARWVWDREIRGWAGDVDIVHIEESLQDLVEIPAAAWLIVTYDILTSRSENFIPPDPITADWLRAALLACGHYSRLVEAKGADDDVAEDLAQAEGTGDGNGALTPFHFDSRADPEIGKVLRNLTAAEGQSINAKVVDRMHRIGRRVSSELLHKLLEWDPDIVFVDEAHRIKNRDAGRTRAVRALIEERSRGAVLMTGTPLRNHGGEGASLLDAILPGAKDRLVKCFAKGYWRSARKAAAEKAIKEILDAVMIRRLKQDVLDLPDKIRQWVDVAPQGDALVEYHDVMTAAIDTLGKQIAGGATQGAAAQAVMGLLSTARRLLGMAKIANSAVADLIDEVVDAKGACLVFAHHREVIDGMAAQLRDLGRSVAVVHGDTPTHARAEAEKDFQEGRVDVFLGSINAAGEALTLTRADTCIFLELDWVPAAMHQAEDRGHRAGQTAAGYHIISLIAKLDDGVNLDEQVSSVLVEKMANINAILDESAAIAGERVQGSDGTVRTRVIDAMLSHEQRAAAAANTVQKAAQKRVKRQQSNRETKETAT